MVAYRERSMPPASTCRVMLWSTAIFFIEYCRLTRMRSSRDRRGGWRTRLIQRQQIPCDWIGAKPSLFVPRKNDPGDLLAQLRAELSAAGRFIAGLSKSSHLSQRATPSDQAGAQAPGS